MSDIKGRFLWFDLYTTDPAAARAFYTAVVGWTIQHFKDDYQMFVAPGGAMGGVMKLPPQAEAMGAPPHWLAYIGTPNVDETVAQVQQLGGQVYAPPFDIEDVGRCAVVADPQGATFGLYTPSTVFKGDPDAEPTTGQVVWSELMTSDREAGWKFYETIFGWRHTESMDMGPMGLYWMYTVGKRRGLGGMMTKPPEMPVSAWLYYFDVTDLDGALATTQERGGKVMHGPMTVPGGMRVAMCTDPQGGWFALHGK